MIKEWLIKEITKFTSESPENDLHKPADSGKVWGRPLVGFANGDDPIYGFLKKDIGDFWWTPLDAFRRAFPKEKNVTPDQLTVISWALPHTPEIIAVQKREKELPSQDWVRARIYGEIFIDLLRKHMADWLAEAGCQSVAPVLHPEWKFTNPTKYGFAASWSERHTAYIAGLGTFGLCDGLITPIGKAVRFGSVVAKLDLPPTVRPYQDKNEYCLYYAKGTCQACVRRCPAGAITEKGHDKVRCDTYIKSTHGRIMEMWGLKNVGCGLCQAGVPCEKGIPAK